MTHADLTERLDHNWRVVHFETTRPQLSRSERLLRAVWVPSHVARVAAATPALRRRWAIAMALAVFIGLAAGDPTTPRASLFVWLVLAPLVPVFGVSLAFGPDADPAYEVTVSTPVRGVRLAVVRATVVLGVSVPVLSIASALSPVSSPTAFAWLLPALSLSLVSLAVMTFTTPNRAAVFVSVAWVLGTAVARGVGDDPLAAFTVAGQLLAVVVAVAAAVVLVRRRDRFDLAVWAAAS